MNMEADIFKPFATAAYKTFKLLLDMDTLSKVAEKTDGAAAAGRDTDIAIGLAGDVSGEVLYRFPEETTIQIAKLMTGMEFSRIDEFVTSLLSEIAKIISENAVTELSNCDITCSILQPQIIKGRKLDEEKETAYLFSTNVGTEIGDIEILLKLNAS